MINDSVFKKIEILEKEYEKTWGKKVNYTIIPKGMTQEKLVKVLELMVETGDSILVAYSKYKNTTQEHFSEKEVK